MSEQRKAVIKNADMSDQMQQDAVDVASKALSEYNIEKVSMRVACLLASHYGSSLAVVVPVLHVTSGDFGCESINRMGLAIFRGTGFRI